MPATKIRLDQLSPINDLTTKDRPVDLDGTINPEAGNGGSGIVIVRYLM